MPTIEIVSVGAKSLDLNSDDFDFAIIVESELKSHRGIFYDWLNNQKGVIIHLGNPEFKTNKGNGFFAAELIDWKFEREGNSNEPSKFRFLDNYWKEILSLIEKSKDSSSNDEAYFLTDIQFEPDEGKVVELKLNEFYSLHNAEGLSWNTLYKLS